MRAGSSTRSVVHDSIGSGPGVPREGSDQRFSGRSGLVVVDLRGQVALGLVALAQALLELALGRAERAGQLGQLGGAEENPDDDDHDEDVRTEDLGDHHGGALLWLGDRVDRALGWWPSPG